MTDINNTTYDYDRYYNKQVVDPSGEKIGEVGQVYLDDATGAPEWVTVRTGLFGMKETFVPLKGESIEGDAIRVPYTKEQVKGAPSIDPEGHLPEAEEAELYRYYSADRIATTDRTTTDRAAGLAGTDRVADDRVATDRTATGNADLDGEVIRHEERLNVGTENVESGRARIRKHVVTEQQSVSVPVTHEELRVERTPLAEGEVVNGGRLEEGEREVILHEERPVVFKEMVGVEKISVGTEQVQENRTVTADVAKEQVEVVQDGQAVREGVRDDRSVGDKVKDKLDRDNDGHIG